MADRPKGVATPRIPIDRPSEALAVELKTWLDPRKPQHKAVLVKGLIALRNHGGGKLMIGYRDDGRPRDDGPPFDLRTEYHADAIQDLVSRHASERFEIDVEIRTDDEIETAVVTVPAGVRTPVRVKTSVRGQRDDKQHDFLSAGAVPVRTLNPNGRASSSECGDADWERLMQTCFDNREADIARFVRRHLSGLGSEIGTLVGALRALTAGTGDPKDGDPKDFLMLGASLFADEIARQPTLEGYGTMAKWGGREAAIAIAPEPQGFTANRPFLQRILSSLPLITSYPPWADTGGRISGEGPKVRHERWEGFLFGTERFKALTFDVFDPKGLFYEYRLMLRDVIAQTNGSAPRLTLGQNETLADVTEVMMTGLAFARALDVADDAHEIRIAFRWTGLKDRLFDTWSMVSANRLVSDEEVSPTSTISFAADTPPNALAPIIAQAVAPLFRMFRGYEVPESRIDETLRQMIERKSPY